MRKHRDKSDGPEGGRNTKASRETPSCRIFLEDKGKNFEFEIIFT